MNDETEVLAAPIATHGTNALMTAASRGRDRVCALILEALERPGDVARLLSARNESVTGADPTGL